MKTIMASALTLVLLSGAYAQNQESDPKPVDSREEVKVVDSKEFFIRAFEAATAEMSFGQLAGVRADNPQVKAFAKRMVEEHRKGRQELVKHASELKVGVAAGVGDAQKKLIKQLSEEKGPQFDQAYVKSAVERHQKAIRLYESATKNVENKDLRQFAEQRLNVMREHLKQAQDLQKSLQETE